MKARLVRRLLWLAGFACLWLNVVDDPPLKTDAYVQSVTQGEAIVCRITAHPTQLVCTVRDASGAVIGVVHGPAGRRRHALRVTGLQAATDYSYELAEVGGDVEQGRLRTAPSEDRASVKFAFLGDSGGQPWWVWLQRTPVLHWPARWRWFDPKQEVSEIGAAVAVFAPDFMLHLGDLVYPRGLHAHYSSGFFRPFAALMRNAPVYAVLGNHDVMDLGGLQMMSNLVLPSGELTGDSRCHSFAWGAVRVIVLDLNPDLDGRVRQQHPAREFLLAELGSCSEPWIVVASHFPMWSASRQRNWGDLLASIAPVLEEHAVSLYLSGHDHCYQRFAGSAGGLDTVPMIVSGGGGKDLYEVHPHAKAVVLKSQYHWCSVEVQGAALTVRANGLEGEVFDTLRLRLPEGERVQRIQRLNPGRAARIERLR
ncbi:MAG TPA: metallophosphoesterase [Planctomycetota bacterium]